MNQNHQKSEQVVDQPKSMADNNNQPEEKVEDFLLNVKLYRDNVLYINKARKAILENRRQMYGNAY